jgi:hypothetical protein
MNNKSTMISFRVKINSPLFKYLDEYNNTGNTVSEHIRSVLEKHISGDSNANLNHYIAMRRRSDWGKYAHEWCIQNMSEHHYKVMTEFVKDKMADHKYDD